MEFSRLEYWCGQPFPSPGDLPNPMIRPRSPTLQADSLPAEPPGKPKNQERLTQVCLHSPRRQMGVRGHCWYQSSSSLWSPVEGRKSTLGRSVGHHNCRLKKDVQLESCEPRGESSPNVHWWEWASKMWYITCVCALLVTSVMSNSLWFLTIWATREAPPEARSLKASCWQGPALSWDSGRKPVASLLPLAVANKPWSSCLQLQHSNLCLVFTRPSPLHVCVSASKCFLSLCLFYFWCCCFLIWPYCGAWGMLLPEPGIERGPLAKEVQNPNHWTTRKFPKCFLHNKDTRYCLGPILI